MAPHLWVALMACVLATIGCAAEGEPGAATGPSDAPSAHETKSTAEGSDASAMGGEAAADAARARRIVYRAVVDLAVGDFDPLPAQIDSSVKKHHGFISESTITGAPGSPRSGRWTIRIPVVEFAAFLAAVRQLGEERSVNTTSDDITAEYSDTEARIRNKQLEEERLLKLLADATGKLEEVLAVERELSRVRGEIEQAQGRLRVMKDLTELTTVTVSVTEIKNYIPDESPRFLTRVQRSWANSVATFVEAVQSLALLAVALVPWLPIPLVLLLVLVAVRSLSRRWR